MVEAKTPFLFLHDADVVIRDADMLGPLAQTHEITVPGYPGMEGHFDDLDRAWERWDTAADLALHVRREIPRGEAVRVGGAGFGGWVALELALLCPERLESLVLVGPYGVKLRGPMEREFADIVLLDADEQLELGWADPSRAHGLRMPGYPPTPDDAEHETAFAERATLTRYIWKPFLHSPQLGRWLDVIDVPTLVIAGSHDRMVAEGHSRELAERLPRATYVEIPDAGHYPYLEQPDAFAAAVRSFHAQLKG
ncbi:alpha/beta hydrolase [Microbacterium pseudoresistens]|uniref:Pimeloyl-ACP methyl ester carboxylesterase n=1 Tax=Microbacterium pseudoresistens TaxID=640634 RepID=A0A7Y9EU67_9MICO|nr:alpha/beta hydrolase [Microbacterium pseudoresistens]NYD53988.1 pimeloyl-ACP methyl ester carboxylesterase [Microbacterium pseudoresistens]